MLDPIKVRDQPAEEYHGSDPISRSRLFLMSKSPAHFAEWQPEDTAALAFGRALHMLVLQPEIFGEHYFVMERPNLRTASGRQAVADIEAQGLEVIFSEDFAVLDGMRKSVYANKYAAALLRGEKEVSYYWTDPDTGIDCKCRPDCRTELKTTSVIVDLKSCRDASTDAFAAEAVRLGYDLQVAMYRTGVEKIEQKPHKFVFVAVEKSPPYAVNILEADDVMYNKGFDDFRKYLGMLKYCRETNNWYSYTGEQGIPNALSLPAWLAKDYQ